MIILPPRETKTLRQINRGNLLGELWSSFGLELQDNLGAIRLANKMKINSTSASVSNLGFPVAFAYFDSMMWALCGDRIFKNGSSDLVTAFTEDASSGVVTTYDKNYADMMTFNSTLVATADTVLYSKVNAAGAYTNRATLTTGGNHKLCYLKNFDRLYVIDERTKIKSLNTAWAFASSGDYSIDLGTASGTPRTMWSTDTDIYIGMLRQSSSTESATDFCGVLKWDGLSAQVQREFKIDGVTAVLAGCTLNGIPYCMDNNGILRGFNGTTFEEVGRLPFGNKYPTLATSTFNERYIHPNGMIATKNGTIQVLVNNLISDNVGSINENFPSGIWEWSKENGFIHKHPLTLQPMATTTVTDNGQNRVAKVGALYSANIFSTSASGRSDLIAGCQYYSDASTTAHGIFIKAPDPVDNATTTESKKYGYFVSQFFHSQQLKDNWKTLAVKYKKLLNSSDKIIIKYRTREATPTYIDITWVNTTSFTTTTDVSALTGYEVEIIQGTGSGKCSHISTVTGSGTYTVTVDETYTGVTTGTAKARVQAWVKKLEVSDQVTESCVSTLGKSSERIQLKVCMEFTGDDELYEVILVNGTHTKLE